MRQSGLKYTLVRAASFAQNFSEGDLRDPALRGVVALPAGDVREPIVDVDDIADVAVAALTQDRNVRQFYDVIGPKLFSFDEAAAELSSAMGREVRYQSITLSKRHSPKGHQADNWFADRLRVSYRSAQRVCARLAEFSTLAA